MRTTVPIDNTMLRIIAKRLILGTTASIGVTITTGYYAFRPDSNTVNRRRKQFLGSNADRVDKESGLEGIVRFATAATVCARIAYRYDRLVKDLKRDSFDVNAEERRREIESVHEMCSAMALNLARSHGGIYVKLGQYISTLSPLVPKIWTDTLKQLQDRACVRSYEEIKRVLEAELGSECDAFEFFDRVPIAAASLAQVHRARLANGHTDVAVKVQYPGLPQQVNSDLWALEFLANAVSYWFGANFEFRWLLPEFSRVADVELDFEQERRNSKRTKRLFANETDVYVPDTIDHLSTRRVLTMEFVQGARVDDVDTLCQDMEVDPKDVARTMCRVFGDMIFRHGLVHCDPHPGNMLVRRHPENATSTRHQLVILDHGFYRRLDSSFRHQLCELWMGLLTRDAPRVRLSAKHMGISREKDLDALSLVLTFRTLAGRARSAYGTRMSKAEKARIRANFANVSSGDVFSFVESLPRDLLFVLRTMSIVRSINRSLDGTTRERMIAFGVSALRGSHVRDAASRCDAEYAKDVSRLRDLVRDEDSFEERALRRPLNERVETEICLDADKTLHHSSLAVWLLYARLWFADALLRAYAWFLKAPNNSTSPP